MDVITINGSDIYPHVSDSDQMVVKVVRDKDSCTVVDVRVPDNVFYREGAVKIAAMLNDMIIASCLV